MLALTYHSRWERPIAVIARRVDLLSRDPDADDRRAFMAFPTCAANGSKVRSADFHPPIMLQGARMAGLVKPHRSAQLGC